jgi:hypothetical protein
MKPVAIIVTIFMLVSGVANAGGPSIELNDLTVKDVFVSRDKIVIRATGTIIMHTRQTKQERKGKYDGKSVTLDAEDVIWTIVKPSESHLDRRRDIYKNWDAFCKNAETWKNKSVRGQLWFTEITLKDGRLDTIQSESQVIHARG